MSDHEPMLTTATEAGRAAPHPTAEISLLIDVGSAWTKASVVGRTRGRWRIVAHAAQPTNWGEKALIDVLTERMREAVDHRLRDEVPAILESAARITCHTPVRPGRLGVAAVTAEVSGSAARRAAESAGWVVVEEAAADDGRSLPERLSTLTAADVDAWLVVGGFDDARPEQALEAAALVAAARRGGRLRGALRGGVRVLRARRGGDHRQPAAQCRNRGPRTPAPPPRGAARSAR